MIKRYAHSDFEMQPMRRAVDAADDGRTQAMPEVQIAAVESSAYAEAVAGTESGAPWLILPGWRCSRCEASMSLLWV
jgi:hypothetical protein